MSMALKFSKLPSPRICNSCSKVAKYEIRAGIHNLILCYDCCREMMDMIRIDEQKASMVDEMHMQEVSHDKNIS